MIRKDIFYLVLILCLYPSCSSKTEQEAKKIQDEWIGRQIIYPDDFIAWGIDNELFQELSFKSKYKIVTYVDGAGCTSCKLQLPKWAKWIDELRESKNNVDVLFFISPNDAENLEILLQYYGFTYPVYIDEKDIFNQKNNLPTNELFQTFLLDRDNRVVAVGNPIHNPQVKELYLKIIRGEQIGQENESKQIKTEVKINKPSVSLDSFDWQEEQKTVFTLQNTGNRPLVIQDVATSCGCITVAYSKEPVLPGREIPLEVVYKAEHPEHFDKTVTVYCNVETSPLVLKISGNAE